MGLPEWPVDPDGHVENRVAVPYELIHSDPRVAVLTDRRVASSGGSDRGGVPRTSQYAVLRIADCGLPTANSEFTPSDGAVLFLTTDWDADRTMTTYDTSLQPDEEIADASSVVQRAVSRLRSGS